ncbi:MAG TPA: hypothetical protein VIL65_17625 [Beijerinckiaceae bacterium]|jgi:hypothetical protein
MDAAACASWTGRLSCGIAEALTSLGVPAEAAPFGVGLLLVALFGLVGFLQGADGDTVSGDGGGGCDGGGD